MNLNAIAKALGGEVSGRQVNAPGPGHSLSDRSLSVRFDPNAPDGFVVHSHAGDDWKECRDHVFAVLHGEKVELLGPTRPDDDDDQKKLRRARHLWSCRKRVENSPVDAYMLARGYSGRAPMSIGYLEAGAYPWPAMIAAFGLPKFHDLKSTLPDIHGIHLTFLKEDGSDKADIEKPKIMLAKSKGWPIVIGSPSDNLGLFVTEGIGDGLTTHEATRCETWVAGSGSRMPGLAPHIPNCIECITICAHKDEAGRKGAIGLAEALAERDVEIILQGIDNDQNGFERRAQDARNRSDKSAA